MSSRTVQTRRVGNPALGIACAAPRANGYGVGHESGSKSATTATPASIDTGGIVVAVTLAVVLLLGVLSPKASAQLIMSEPPAAWRGMDLTTEVGQQIPLDIPLTESDGTQITTADLFNGDKPAVVILMYYSCPLLCPKTLQEAMKGLSELERFDVGDDYRFIAISFDPRDGVTEAAMKKHAALGWYNRPKTAAIENEFRFFVGKEDDTQAIADAIGFPYRFLPESGEYSHPTVLFVVTPDGRISTYLAGLQFPARHLRLSLIDAGEGKLGNVIDRVLLWCYHFDPSVGGYTLVAFRVMQVASIACAVALGTLVGLLILGERVRSKHRRRRLVESQAGTKGGAEDAAGPVSVSSAEVLSASPAKTTASASGDRSSSVEAVGGAGRVMKAGVVRTPAGGGGADLSFRSSPRERAGSAGGSKA